MNKNNHNSILNSVRDTLNENGLSAIIIPHGDEYQNEFVPVYNQRLRHVTGFTGSAGFAIITTTKAVVMSDGRYSIQLKQEIDQSLFEIGDSTKQTQADWLIKNCPPKSMIAYDPWLHTEQSIRGLAQSLSEHDLRLYPLSKNIIDEIWLDRPAKQWGDVEIFPIEYAGLPADEKIKHIQSILKTKNVDSTLISLPDSVSWCLNVRSNDVQFNPVLLARLLIHKEKKPVLFIDQNRCFDTSIMTYLNSIVDIDSIENLSVHLEKNTHSILLDPQRIPKAVFDYARMVSLSIEEGKDPSVDLKACKNEHEQNAMRSAHKKDAAALISFLTWLDNTKEHQDLNELSITDKLETFRRNNPAYKGKSFDTICGWNANGAIIHYRATEKNFASIAKNENGILLLDSGGQYEDGTTDITRTLSFGVIPDTIKRENTLVLKGMIGLSKTIFPYGTTGAELDVRARKPLQDHGLDYAHGTGHGVGCHLSVHEEATGISPRSHDKMEVGMIVSNEPGYYKENSHGIRIENLILCVDTFQKNEIGSPLLTFETLTLVPLDKTLIDQSLLDKDEIDWINHYHQRIFNEISPLLDDITIKWLSNACKAL